MGGANPRPGLWRRGTPRVAGHKPATPPGMESVREGRTKMVRRSPAEKTIPGVARAWLSAAAILPGRVARQLAAATRAVPRRLEIPPDAPEMPSRCDDQGAPMALARVVE